MLFVILLATGFITWIAVETINGWNNDPLGNRSGYHRPKNARFKNYYGLTDAQAIEEFEHKMATGMFCDDREVFVTAFCRNGIVRRVTATMGTDSQCCNSDSISEWPSQAKRLDCFEIRQYHNHTNRLGRKTPSKRDLISHHWICEYFEKYNIHFQSFLVYANYLNGWVIREYGNANQSLERDAKT